MTDSTSQPSCPYCKEPIQPKATVCPHCQQAIFSTDPGANAILYLISFVVIFTVLWMGINWFAKVQTNQLLRDSQQQVDEMMRQ